MGSQFSRDMMRKRAETSNAAAVNSRPVSGLDMQLEPLKQSFYGKIKDPVTLRKYQDFLAGDLGVSPESDFYKNPDFNTFLYAIAVSDGDVDLRSDLPANDYMRKSRNKALASIYSDFYNPSEDFDGLADSIKGLWGGYGMRYNRDNDMWFNMVTANGKLMRALDFVSPVKYGNGTYMRNVKAELARQLAEDASGRFDTREGIDDIPAEDFLYYRYRQLEDHKWRLNHMLTGYTPKGTGVVRVLPSYKDMAAYYLTGGDPSGNVPGSGLYIDGNEVQGSRLNADDIQAFHLRNHDVPSVLHRWYTRSGGKDPAGKAAIDMLASWLLGQSPEHVEEMYNLKRTFEENPFYRPGDIKRLVDSDTAMRSSTQIAMLAALGKGYLLPFKHPSLSWPFRWTGNIAAAVGAEALKEKALNTVTDIRTDGLEPDAGELTPQMRIAEEYRRSVPGMLEFDAKAPVEAVGPYMLLGGNYRNINRLGQGFSTFVQGSGVTDFNSLKPDEQNSMILGYAVNLYSAENIEDRFAVRDMNTAKELMGSEPAAYAAKYGIPEQDVLQMRAAMTSKYVQAYLAAPSTGTGIRPIDVNMFTASGSNNELSLAVYAVTAKAAHHSGIGKVTMNSLLDFGKGIIKGKGNMMGSALSSWDTLCATPGYMENITSILNRYSNLSLRSPVAAANVLRSINSFVGNQNLLPVVDGKMQAQTGGAQFLLLINALNGGGKSRITPEQAQIITSTILKGCTPEVVRNIVHGAGGKGIAAALNMDSEKYDKSLAKGISGLQGSMDMEKDLLKVFETLTPEQLKGFGDSAVSDTTLGIGDKLRNDFNWKHALGLSLKYPDKAHVIWSIYSQARGSRKVSQVLYDMGSPGFMLCTAGVCALAIALLSSGLSAVFGSDDDEEDDEDEEEEESGKKRKRTASIPVKHDVLYSDDYGGNYDRNADAARREWYS